jgi:uncharacterized protein (TIGR02271 family)
MTKTVTSLFRSQCETDPIVSHLEHAGIRRGSINVYTSVSGDFTDALSTSGVPTSDAHAYAEGVRRGGALVVVSCDNDEVDRVLDILDHHEGIPDLNDQQTSWRSEGWQGHDTSMTGTTGGLGTVVAGLGAALSGDPGSNTFSADQTRSSVTARAGTGDGEEVIPVAEEELHVGKREVNRGRIRIHSHVVERPVEEQVTLRAETIEVERRPVSRDAHSVEDVFQERTVEVEEHDEQAVVSKEARVKEELVVHKDVEQRTQTISDTVRRTEVDVEDERGVRGTGTTDSSDRRR